MADFDPNKDRSQIESYLCNALERPVRFAVGDRLAKSTREVPWRLDVEVDGIAQSYVLRWGTRTTEHEYQVLRAMENVPKPTPRVYGWDPTGEFLGAPCFLCDFIVGESLLWYLLAGESWAETLYIESACVLQAISWEQMSSVAHLFGDGETAADILEAANDFFRANPIPLAGAVYAKLKALMPAMPAVRFSNGDLYPDNLLVRDRRLVGVIDFENSGFSDPLYEFLLPFFVHPELRGRRIEARFCERMGLGNDSLPWYRALELFDTWRWVQLRERPFVHHTAESLSTALERWLAEA